MTGVPTVLVADHTGVLAATLAHERPVARVASGEAALDAVARLRPIVVVVHGELPPEGGVALAGRLAPTGVAVVLALARCEPPLVAAALRAGARAVVERSVATTHGGGALARAIEAGERGELLVSPLAALRALAAVGGSDRVPFPRLTAREREVLALMTRDADVGRIAGRLGLARKTVRDHVARVVAKTGAADAADAARRARATGITAVAR